MTVKDLINLLKKYDDDLEVEYASHSEGINMPIADVGVESINQKLIVIVKEW